jgi:dihydroorotate dehydrogenase electron transfer subunit
LITAAQKEAQKNRNSIFVEDGELLAIEAHPGEQFIMRIRAPKCAKHAEPGSFVHLTCDAALPMRRPLSIMRVDGDSIEILYKTVGQGLRLLSGKKPGDTISVLGPIGQPLRL